MAEEVAATVHADLLDRREGWGLRQSGRRVDDGHMDWLLLPFLLDFPWNVLVGVGVVGLFTYYVVGLSSERIKD